MPMPNDLTPEEEAEFAQHGVAPAGAGGEPIAEGQEEAPPEAEGALPEGSEPVAEPKPGELASNRRENGTYKSKEEFDADQATLAAQAPPSAAQPSGEQRMVPHAALHAERLRVAELTRTSQLATARLNAILTQQSGQSQPPAMPDLQNDPAGYLQALEGRLSAFEQARAEEQQYRQVDEALNQDERLFSQSVPDYDQASDHYVQSRARELLQFHTPQDAQRILTAEARNIASQAWQRGMSAGAMVYQLAQARGYVPGNTAANPQRNPIPQEIATPARPGPSQGNPGGPAPQAAIAATRAAQAASRSLSGGGAGAGANELNAQAILAMSDDEFEDYLGLGTKGADARFAAIG